MIVTGGGRGIGAATARLAAERGYAVCVNYVHNGDTAATVVNDIERGSGTALAVQADICEEHDVLRLFETAARELGPVVGLVNNAGAVFAQKKLQDMEASRIRQIFAVNVFGSFLCAREAVRRMSTENGGNGGTIVNVSSVAARLGSPGTYIDYAASKGAIETMTVGLAKEVAAEGIRVNCVRPGLIYTDMHADSGDPERPDRLKDTVPMKRIGNPSEVAETILWLTSDSASYVIGSIIDVSGGR